MYFLYFFACCIKFFTITEFLNFVKKELGIKYYGRYVDDFVIILQNKDFLKSLIPKIRNYLQKELQLQLHPIKTYKIRKKIIREKLSGWWGNYFYAKAYSKFVSKKRIVFKETDRKNQAVYFKLKIFCNFVNY